MGSCGWGGKTGFVGADFLILHERGLVVSVGIGVSCGSLAVSFWRRGGRPGADSGVSLSPGPLSAMMLIRPYAKKTVAAYLSRCRRQPPIESTPRLKRQAWANGFTSDVGRSWKPKRRRHRLVEQAASNTTIGNVDYPKRGSVFAPNSRFFLKKMRNVHRGIRTCHLARQRAAYPV